MGAHDLGASFTSGFRDNEDSTGKESRARKQPRAFFFTAQEQERSILKYLARYWPSLHNTHH